MRYYDVVIAGGGPAGAAAALTLACAGLKVLMADAYSTRGFKIGEGLPPSARSLLRDLGVLERVLADGHRPSFGTLAFWGADEPHANDFIYQLFSHGLQLDRTKFDSMLRRAAQEEGVDVYEKTRLLLDANKGLSPSADQQHRFVLKTPEANEVIESNWLIDAGGRPAVLSRHLGARRIQVDALLAMYMRLGSRCNDDYYSSTLVEAVSDGWWYSVLLPSGERLVAFLFDADLVDRRQLLSREGFWNKLQETHHLQILCKRHGYMPISTPHGTDASSGMLDHAVGDCWLAVGDAALSFDPLSSKGIANAMYTGIRGAEAVISALRGDDKATIRYNAHLAAIFRVYTQQLADFYAIETRWQDMQFWRRRLSAHTTLRNL